MRRRHLRQERPDAGRDDHLGLGQEATCTITNNDNAPVLHLRKIVINDNGGPATVADFTLTANGTGTNDLSGISPVDSDATLDADTFALSETSPAGYTASDWVCVGGTYARTPRRWSRRSTSASARKPPAPSPTTTMRRVLHLRKIVINDNGGPATVADFTLTANGTGTNDLSGISPVDSDATLDADTFVLSETSPAGYTNE